MINNIKTYSFLILSLLLAWGQLVIGQEVPDPPPIITSVTVKPLQNNPGAVEIYWTDTRDSYGYIILKKDPNPNSTGFQPYDTVYFPIQKYIDSIASGNTKSEGFKIQSFSKISNGEILGESENSAPSYTIYLNPIKYDSCQMTNTLTWNPYVGWDGKVSYDVYKDGNDNKINTQDVHSTYTDSNITAGEEYSYFIKATSNSDRISVSNQAAYTADSLISPNSDNFYINKITYNGTTANFTAVIDTSADLLGHALMVSGDNKNFTKVDFDTINKNIPTIEFRHDTINQPLFYKVNAIGVCKDTVQGKNVVKPIDLKVKDSNETEVTLDWNTSYIESSETYTLSVQIDGENPNDITSGLESLTYTYTYANNTGEQFCFTVNATENQSKTSSSNTVCTSRVPKLNFPNAFSPNSDGTNDRFGPFAKYIENVDLAEFKITIYDKYGGAIYIANDAESFWTGISNRASLKYVSEGGYIYYIWIKTAQGKTYEKSGTINVVYP